MQVGKYNLENEIKANDAVRSVGDKDKSALLAEYDRRGGLLREEVTVDGSRTYIPVPLGTFWDFAKGEARKVPLTGRPKVLVRAKKGKGGKK